MKLYLYSFLAISMGTSFILSSCKKDTKPAENTQQAVIPGSDDPEKQGQAMALTIDGRKLTEWNDPDSIKAIRKEALDKARNVYLGHTEDVKGYVMYGNEYIKFGRPENAINIFSKGIEKFPNTADLYLGRAKAYIIARQFQDAVNDSWQAGKAIEGQPQARGILKLTGADSVLNPTLHFLNYLNMGIAFQCAKDFSNAEKMFEVCGDFSNNPDLFNIAYYYQYQCYTRAGREADAKNIMNMVDKSKNSLAPGRPYLDALLYWKGLKSEAELVDINAIPQNSVDAEAWLIKAYALAYKAQLEKKNDKAAELLQKILLSGYWSQYPYILAEVDLNTLRGFKAPTTETIELKGSGKKK